MNPLQVDERLTRLTNIIAIAVAMMVGIALPALFLVGDVEHQMGEVHALSHIRGSLVTNAINKNPDMWRFEEHKLLALVTPVHKDKYPTVYKVLDKDHGVIAASSDMELPWPTVAYRTMLYDFGKPVGLYSVERSLRDMLLHGLPIVAAGILLALIIVLPLRALPLRALKRSQQRLMHMAHHDALTGLPNKALLTDRLNQAILYAQRYQRCVTLVCIDLDNFKTVNDSLGHDVGDELLKQTAARMQQAVRRTDTVVRLGGDEFIIILFDQPEKTESLTGTLQKIREAVAQPLLISGHTLQVTCSMGLAAYPGDGEDVTTLLKNADAAMYQAKELGRNNFQFYTEEMNSRLKERIFLQQGMRNALANGEFTLMYQPQVHTQTGDIIGVEALLRWKHPQLGMISPAKFIPLAEESGMIVPIGEWVLRSACRQNKAWQELGIGPLKVSVNVSARQFKESNWIATVADTLKESGLDPQYLELEITESLIMENIDRAVEVMNELQKMNVQLSIDDFGTGYSSLSSLKNFPVARLKIDQSFIRSLPGNDDDKSIAMAVIALAHRLSLKVVAEGVETAQQRAFLQENECDEMQGYHFSKPVPPEEIGKMFAQPAAIPYEA